MPLFGSLTGSWVHVRSTHGVGPCMTKYGDTDVSVVVLAMLILNSLAGECPSPFPRFRARPKV